MENREGLDALLGDDPDPTRQYREAYRQQPTLRERLETARAAPAAAAPAWLSNTSQTPTNRIDSNDPYKYDALQTHDPVGHGEQALLAPTISYEDAIGLGIPSLVGKAVTAGAAKLGAAGFMGGAGIFHLHPNPAAAARMEAQGASKEEIWKEMQAYKDRGGNWLGETDDSQAVFTPGKFKDQEWGLGKLFDSVRKRNPDAYEHPVDMTTAGGLKITLDDAGKAHPYPTNYLPSKHPLNVSGTMRGLFSHPELYNKLPAYNLEHTPVRVYGGARPPWVSATTEGQYDPALNEISIFTNPFEPKKKLDQQKFSAWLGGDDDAFAGAVRIPTDTESTLLHEAQHAIQEKEGRDHGASNAEHIVDIPKHLRSTWDKFMSDPKNITRINDPTYRSSTVPNWRDRFNMFDRYKQGFNNYLRSAGETEARLTQSRQMLSPQERRDLPPWHAVDSKGKHVPGTMDVPTDQQIYIPPGRAIDLDSSADPAAAFTIAKENYVARAPYRKYVPTAPPPTAAQVAGTATAVAGIDIAADANNRAEKQKAAAANTARQEAAKQQAATDAKEFKQAEEFKQHEAQLKFKDRRSQMGEELRRKYGG
jgi:hypothetical protein